MDSLNPLAREALTDLCRQWQVMELAVFGSVARGSSRPDSDIDLLVTFCPDAPWNMLDIVDLRRSLPNCSDERLN